MNRIELCRMQLILQFNYFRSIMSVLCKAHHENTKKKREYDNRNLFKVGSVLQAGK